MKKKLEADLISIAHRILQLKNKSDINQLYTETQKLYEKLSVLRFVEEHYAAAKPTITHAEIEKEIETFYDQEASLPIETVIEMTENIPVEQTQEITNEALETTVTAVEEPAVEEIVATVKTEEPIALQEVEDEITVDESIETTDAEIEEAPEEEIAIAKEEEEVVLDFKTNFELTEEKETTKKPAAVQISLEDLLGGNYSEPQFVKVDDIKPLPVETVFEAVEKKIDITIEPTVPTPAITMEKTTEDNPPKIVSLNEKLSKGIEIDLNDRIAFVKHLFGNSNEDYNRVLNQLITFDNFYETKNFIDEMVKPDYNNWYGKDDYADRFMDIIEKKFL